MRKAGKLNFSLLFLGLLVFIFSTIGCDIPSAPISDRSGDRDLARLLEKMRVKAHQAALAAAVISDGKIKAAAAVGTRKFPTENWVTVDDRFVIGSCGKAFTSALAARMVEDGELRWVTTIRDVFPHLKMRSEYETISLQQLLSHRAGLPKNFSADLNPRRSYSPTAARLVYLSQLVRTKPANPPGSSMLYSNAGYIVAGVLMEMVSGKEFTVLMSEKIFKPLGLTTAGYGFPPETGTPAQPWGHVRNPSSRSLEAVQGDDAHWLDPAGNVRLSITDWARFILAQWPSDKATPDPFFEPQTLQKLHSPPDKVCWAYDEDYFTFWKNETGWPLTSANYALGWFVTESKTDKTTLNHGGTSKAFQAEVYLSPNRKNALLIATNARMGHIHLYRTAVRINEAYALKIDLP